MEPLQQLSLRAWQNENRNSFYSSSQIWLKQIELYS